MRKLPKYMEIYLDIKSKIKDDTYPVGNKLPTGESLAKNYNTSRLTVKKGLDLLVKEGLVRSRSGFGSEVLRKPIDNSKIFGPSDGLLSVIGEEHVSSRIQTFSLELPSEKVAEMLNISTMDYVYNIIRTRLVDNKPYSLEQTFMPINLIPGLQPQHLEKSIYSYIRDELNLDILSSHIWIKGDTANEIDARLLEIPIGEFLIEVDKVVSLASGEPFEYSLARHTYQDFIFEAVFVQN